MRILVLPLACAVFVGHSRRVQRTKLDEDTGKPLETLPHAFFSSNLEAAFSLAGPRVGIPVVNPINRGKTIERFRFPVAQAEASLRLEPARRRGRSSPKSGRTGRGQPPATKVEAQEEARSKSEEDSRLQAEEDVRAKAEEEARIKTQEEEEARAKAEEEARLKAEEEARVKAEEEARHEKAADLSIAIDPGVEQDIQTSEPCEWEDDEDFHIGVIGAGPYGLTTAAIAKARGYRVTVLEKQKDLGGDWRQWGNPWSKLQIHRDSYMIRSPNNIYCEAEEDLPLYPSREQMLNYFRSYADTSGISSDIIFEAKVTGRVGTRLFYEKGGKKKSILFSHIYAAPGRVNSRSQMNFDSESNFQGLIACGSGGDLNGVSFQGKNVVIIGHGSFAIENARHALESGAEQVIMIARKETLVYPRVVSYAMDYANFNHAPHVFGLINKMYAVADYPASELINIASPPFKTMPPTSDVFFLAIASGKLKVIRGEVANLQEHSVTTKEGDEFPADVFIKCLGFQRDTKLDAELIEPGSGDIEEQWHMNFVDYDGRVYVGSCSNCECHHYPNSYPSDRESAKFFANVDGDSWRNFGQPGGWQDPLEFHAEIQEEWRDYCRLFGVDIPYPFTEGDVKWAFRLS